jgi:multiple sugar transport system permease protein
MSDGHFTFDNYITALWNTSDFWFYFWNSMGYSIPILIGTLILAVTAGYAFAKFKFPGRKILMVLFIVVMMIPYQVMISPTYIVLNNIHLVNTRTALILPNIFTPFGTYLIYQFIRSIPDETIEAARLDGAGNIRILFSIIIPQIKAGIVSLLILNFIDTWNMVEQPLMYMKDVFKYPLSASLTVLQAEGLGTAFVCAVVFLFPVLLLFIIGKEYLVEGIQNSVVGK